MTLFPNEDIVDTLGNITLTSHRLRQELKPGTFKSIMLDNVDAIECEYKENQSYINTAVVSFVISSFALFCFFNNIFQEDLRGLLLVVAIVGIVVGILFILAYYQSRRHELMVSAQTANMSYTILGTDMEEIISFTDKIEMVRSTYIGKI